MKFLIIFFYLFIISIGFYFGTKVTIFEQQKIYSSLTSVASIIFGVMGAWIAIIYPEALKKVFIWDTDPNENYEILNKMFWPMRVSIVTVCFCLLVSWFEPVFKQITFLLVNKNILRQFSFAILGFLVLSELFSLLYTLIPINNADNDVKEKINTRRAIDGRNLNVVYTNEDDEDVDSNKE